MARKLPGLYRDFLRDYPACADAYEALATASREASGLPPREAALVKLAFALGASLEGAAHAHARRALSEGASKGDLRGVALLGITTLGFPTTMRSLAWVEDVVGKQPKEKKRKGRARKGETKKGR